MSFILGAVTICDPVSGHHDRKADILIENGIIVQISDSIDHAEIKRADLSGLQVSPGWFDMSVHFNDPGNEHKEGITNGLDLLMSSGFTGAGIVPNTEPVLQRKTDISYILSKSEAHVINLYPYGAVTVDCEGGDLTEMIDMYHSGAVAFTDGIKPIDNADIFLKTLLYLQRFDGLLLQRPQDRRLSLSGSMHEGKVSTTLGLKGMPAIAEVLIVQRDLRLLKYTGGKLHFSAVSTEESVALIREAKQQGLQVTCDVALHQLLLTEDHVGDYNTNMKVNPPLRSEKDRQALVSGVIDGTIEVITSHHIPHDEESKKMEFDLADFGMLGIQTFYPLIRRLSDQIPFETLLKCFTTNPRRILGLSHFTIEEGHFANLTIFSDQQKWNYDLASNLSASANSPFLGERLQGKALGVVVGDQYHIDK